MGLGPSDVVHRGSAGEHAVGLGGDIGVALQLHQDCELFLLHGDAGRLQGGQFRILMNGIGVDMIAIAGLRRQRGKRRLSCGLSVAAVLREGGRRRRRKSRDEGG